MTDPSSVTARLPGGVGGIRKSFIDFFAAADHLPIPSGPLVPRNDPTLLFANSGMVQFKNVFTGQEAAPAARAVTAQKCLRAGGKHNDLENVGYTSRHQTFFEMLGNFSFGDYFKERAIKLAWDLVTGEFGLPKDRLVATVYAEDEEAYGLWRRIAGLNEHQVIRIPTSDNFWSMGDVGPCGPCSEIFFDHGPAVPGGPPGSADEDGDRFIEIWNLVFMQYEQQPDGKRIALPRPSIDTGMGIERIAAVLQGTHDNYAIDLLRAIIEACGHASNTDPDGPQRVSHRVIADHLRASAFLIADGILPGNDGRSYVLRRIMRRGMRHISRLGVEEPLMHKLVPVLIEWMGAHYTELRRAEKLIRDVLLHEETRFRDALDRGLRILADETKRLGDGEPLPGRVAFLLYDTYGFPLDLTEDVMRAEQRVIDHAGFEAEMTRQRERARRAWVGSGDVANEAIWFRLREQHGASEFLGYETMQVEGRVLALLDENNQETDHLHKGQRGAILVNQTCFYAEAGGQQGDKGWIENANGARFIVEDTQRRVGTLFLHIGFLESGTLAVSEDVTLAIDTARRARLRANHSATHLLHAALRRRFGEHVTQKGSLVGTDRLRFDVSHPHPISPVSLHAIEDEVNLVIRGNSEVTTRLLALEQAIEEGAMALFGEKYDEEVRVVAMLDTGKPYSLELCGGTHVARLGEIGAFRILSEGAVASGVRRIEAVTGACAGAWARAREELLDKVSAALRVQPEAAPERAASLLQDKRQLEREIEKLRRSLALSESKPAASNAQTGIIKDRSVGGVRFISRELLDMPASNLKIIADDLKREIGSGIVLLIGKSGGKASLVVGVTDDLTARFDAVLFARKGAEALGGKGGGGRPDMAQAGGPCAEAAGKADEAIEQAIHDAASLSAAS